MNDILYNLTLIFIFLNKNLFLFSYYPRQTFLTTLDKFF